MVAVIIGGQSLVEGRAIPSVKMHADFRVPAGDCFGGKSDIRRIDGHFVISEIGRLYAVSFAELLEARQVARVLCGDIRLARSL